MSSVLDTFLVDILHQKDLASSQVVGDLDMIEGLDNVQDALLRRLVTVPGSLVHRPEYGVGICQFQGAPNTIETRRRIALAINEQFALDPRVEKVLGVSVDSLDAKPELVTIKVRLKLLGYGEQALSFNPFSDQGAGV